MTDKKFNAFLDNCHEELRTKQASLMETYNLGKFDEYWVDQTSATMQFKNDGEVKLEFRIVPIGSWSGNNKSWMWAWANQSIVDNLRAESLKLKELEDYTGFDIFSKEVFEAEELMAHELTAMAIHHLSAVGMYIVPSDNRKIFFALLGLK